MTESPHPAGGDDASATGEADQRIPLARPLACVVARPAAGEHAPAGIGDDPRDLMCLAWVPALRCAANLLIVLAVFVCLQVIVVAACMPEMLVSPEAAAEKPPDVTVMIPIGLGLSAAIIVLLRWQRVPVASIGLTSRKLAVNLLWGIPAAVASFAVFYVFALVMAVAFPEGYAAMEDNVNNVAAIVPDAPLSVLAGIMACVVIYEEIFFRGLLMTHFRRIFRSWPVAVVAGAACFAAVHGAQQAIVAVPLFGIAVVWSVFAVWRRSLVPAMVAHFVFNFAQVVGLYLIGGNAVSDKLHAACVVLVQGG